jgi:hypothetical protein
MALETVPILKYLAERGLEGRTTPIQPIDNVRTTSIAGMTNNVSDSICPNL